MTEYNIMAIVLDRRSKNAPEVQSLLTRYGCIIKVRLGLHEAGNACSEEGLILLQLVGEGNQINEFESELNSMEGVRAKRIKI